MPGRAFRSAAVAVLISTVAAFGAGVVCVTGLVGVAGAGCATVPGRSAAKTGAAIVKASRPIDSGESFNIVVSELGRESSSLPKTKPSVKFFPLPHKRHKWGISAVITFIEE